MWLYGLAAVAAVLVGWVAVAVVRPALPVWRAGGRLYRGGYPPYRSGEGAARAWLRKTGYRVRVTGVSFAGRPLTDADLARLRPALERFPELSTLRLDRTRVTGSGFAHLVGLKRLNHLLVERLRFTYEQVRALERAVADLRGGGYSDRLMVYFHSRPDHLDMIVFPCNSMNEQYAAWCGRCGCCLPDDPGSGGVTTFGGGGVTALLKIPMWYEGLVCVACPKHDGKPFVLCDQCHPRAAGTACPDCGGPLTPAAEETLIAAHKAHQNEYFSRPRRFDPADQ